MASSCPVCRSSENRFFLRVFDHKKKERFNLLRCENCGLGFLYPLPAGKKLAGYYSDDYYGDSEKGIVKKLDENLKRAVFREHLKHIRRYVKKGRLLDIGCGKGAFLDFARKNGWQVKGVEMSSYASGFARDRGIEVINKSVQNARFRRGEFDAITMFNVLEHLDDPVKILKRNHDWLKDEGIVLVEVPNMDSLQEAILRENWCHLDVPRHLLHFNKRSFRKLVRSSGFRIVDDYSVVFSIHETAGWLNSLSLMLRKNRGEQTRDAAEVSLGFNLKLFGLLLISHAMRAVPSFLNFRPAVTVYILKKVDLMILR